ncbi:MAG: circadian clock KaiB family protein [Rhodospirillaceae bacterium]
MTTVVLRLYVTGKTPSAEKAVSALAALRNALGEDRISIETFDVLENPDAALEDGVYATPTVFRIKPEPVRRVFGNLSSPEMLIAGLQLMAE